jgi:hypothetical protein
MSSPQPTVGSPSPASGNPQPQSVSPQPVDTQTPQSNSVAAPAASGDSMAFKAPSAPAPMEPRAEEGRPQGGDSRPPSGDSGKPAPAQKPSPSLREIDQAAKKEFDEDFAPTPEPEVVAQVAPAPINPAPMSDFEILYRFFHPSESRTNQQGPSQEQNL